ncbi:polysaccharide deacetylase family protein [Bacillus litorisediminis]|uniref:polysaccharide deacetylase family protein n=1 Tax=Bacillus litorisediminis TaxID=2922713 RepID=UPI001FAB8173|nr:polysaccharide deacetylase family protein [Bacillus litorisediminis]
MKLITKVIVWVLLLGLSACSIQGMDNQPHTDNRIIEPPKNNAIPKWPEDPLPPIPDNQEDGQNEMGNDASKPPAKNNEPVKLVDYEGPVEHIFFHPLIVYPELAFDGDAMAQGYNDYFVTVNEFKRVLNELYKNNYILIDINELFQINGDQSITRRELKLPEGKKPLILSIDDMNYYDYMRENGNVYKLVLNENGTIASYAKSPQGEDLISYDHAIVPILDQFVQSHPDFSFRGAKGLIALTGYEGVLGYRTNQVNSPAYHQEKADALKVIRRLKETGWTFASHGWGHLDANKVDYNRFVQDTERWKQEVESLVGPTNVYIYPYGSRPDTGGDKFNYLFESGFKILCSVGPSPYLQSYETKGFMMDRRHIDGIALQTQQERLRPLMDAEKVLEAEVRP